MRVKVWEANWVEPMAQGIDFHEFYLHRGVNVWRLFNYRLPFFRPKVAYTGGVKITSEGDTWVNAAWAAPHFGQGYHPGVDAKWPRRVWWRRLPGGAAYRGGDPPLPALSRRAAQRRAAEQDPRDDRREHPLALDGAGRRARHARVDVHAGAKAGERARGGVAMALVSRVPEAEHHHRDQRAGGPRRVQARTPQPRAAAEARPARRRPDLLPPPPGAAGARLPAARVRARHRSRATGRRARDRTRVAARRSKRPRRADEPRA